MTDPGQVAASDIDLSRIDLTRASAARVYDYYLGGFHNFPVDRDLAEATIALNPEARPGARAARSFLRRAVTHLTADLGVRQFLDLGSGIPTAGNVHEIAQAVDPAARVVYVDIDPVATAHGQMILADNPNAQAAQGDLRDPGAVLDLPAVRDLIDPTRPTALLLSLVLHFVQDDDDPAGMIRRYREALGSGSWLALSHATKEFQPEQSQVSDLYRRHAASPVHHRDRAQVTALLDGYQLIPPGLVLLAQWRPGRIADVPDPERIPAWAGIARAC
jgi:S-adenosyl methyltransferase